MFKKLALVNEILKKLEFEGNMGAESRKIPTKIPASFGEWKSFRNSLYVWVGDHPYWDVIEEYMNRLERNCRRDFPAIPGRAIIFGRATISAPNYQSGELIGVPASRGQRISILGNSDDYIAITVTNWFHLQGNKLPSSDTQVIIFADGSSLLLKEHSTLILFGD